MDYFKRLRALLQLEQDEDRQAYLKLTATASAAERRNNGITWYPIAIRDTELGRGDYLTVEVERTTHTDISHQLRSGMPVVLFSNHDPQRDREEGTITFLNGNRLKIALRTDELPDWSRNGKLGIDLLFDDNSYEEMEQALKQAEALAGNPKEGKLVQVLTGQKAPAWSEDLAVAPNQRLNPSQQEALQKILSAQDLAIVHGPPGTGKTTTLVQAIKALHARDQKQILVVAPSNAAVDLLSEKLADEGLKVLRAGNPARISPRLLSLTLDSQAAEDSRMKDIKKLKKQANAFRDMAHKYKRQFGKAEREQRKALFDEARKIMKEVEQTEQYIYDSLIARAQVITATLVGANHYSIRNLRYHTVVIDEAGQALEPACWIPILKAEKLVMAGDHFQLPPTIKSIEAGKQGLNETLMERCVQHYPEAVTMLEEQYRMHASIMGYSAQVFYGDRLKAHASVAGHLLEGDALPLAFVDTAGCGFEEKAEGTSLSNPEEAAFTLKHLSQLVEQLHAYYPADQFPSIAVIAPYRQQIEQLRELQQHYPALVSLGERLSVNTVDSFQGQERDIVYISMTRSNTDNAIGFLADTRRMNVAMTRARKKLVMIGDSATLSILPFYADLISYAEQIDAYQSAWAFSDL
ncbi:AAA domain-containing protein [Taibaiella koreensis]|uniref:AAA domain-containing protein n=1 Tax=Taibaiella koreensis TaxID=1268548 RepID=UPI000E5999D3|nr:AAA domain-containing protein [Taibaiella koreensis]